MNRDMLCTIPIWVKLHQLSLHLYGDKSLGNIGSEIGKPFFTYECTIGKFRVSYATILVEVGITQKSCEDVSIKDNEGRKIKHMIEYEWKHVFCESC